MTRPPLPPDAGRRRIRFTTGVTAATATTAAALFGVLFAQSSPSQAVASPAPVDLPRVEPSPWAEPPARTDAAPRLVPSTTAPGRADSAPPTPRPPHHNAHRSAPVQPPPQPPKRSSGRGNVSSGAS